MKKRMLEYMAYMNQMLERMEAGDENVRTERVMHQVYDEHMNQISFFMHERLIHLIVTVLFAIGTFMTIFTFLMVDNLGLLLLALLLIVLLVPYIKHYYLLENGVQSMYEQYDRMRAMMDEYSWRKDSNQDGSK